jgi:hypothetical protein
MRRKLGWLSLIGFVILLAIDAIPIDAGIRPSFSVVTGVSGMTANK